MSIHLSQDTKGPSPILSAPPSAMQMVEHIAPWPHWSVIAQVAAKEYQLPTEDFERLFPESQRFLALRIVEEETIKMYSHQADVLWHAQMLHSRLSETFCLKYARRRVSHVPHLTGDTGTSTCEQECNATPDERCGGPDGKPTTAEDFARLYEAAFGKAPCAAVWFPGTVSQRMHKHPLSDRKDA